MSDTSRSIIRGDTTYAPRASLPNLLLDVPDPFEEDRARAMQRGYEDGRAEAGETVRRQREVERDQVQLALQTALDALGRANTQGRSAWEKQLRQIQDDAVHLAYAVLESLLSRELEVANNPGVDALVRALALALENGETTVRMHPADLELLQGHEVAHGLHLVGDEQIERGGCLVDLGSVIIDARLESALGRVRAALGLSEVAEP